MDTYDSIRLGLRGGSYKRELALGGPGFESSLLALWPETLARNSAQVRISK